MPTNDLQPFESAGGSVKRGLINKLPGTIFALTLIAGLAILAMNARAENADREAGRPAARMTRLTERVWVCQLQYAEQKPKGFFPVIVSRDGLVVVDTPMFPSEARAMRAAIIDELGPSTKPSPISWPESKNDLDSKRRSP